MYDYRLTNDGYVITKDGEDYLIQEGIASKPFIKNGTYEENVVAHIAQLVEDENKATEPSLEELNRADIDYLFMMMEV